MIDVIAGSAASQWSCANGQCVNITSRCDFVSDCLDASDEHNCSTLRTLLCSQCRCLETSQFRTPARQYMTSPVIVMAGRYAMARGSLYTAT